MAGLYLEPFIRGIVHGYHFPCAVGIPFGRKVAYKVIGKVVEEQQFVAWDKIEFAVYGDGFWSVFRSSFSGSRCCTRFATGLFSSIGLGLRFFFFLLFVAIFFIRFQYPVQGSIGFFGSFLVHPILNGTLCCLFRSFPEFFEKLPTRNLGKGK